MSNRSEWVADFGPGHHEMQPKELVAALTDDASDVFWREHGVALTARLVRQKMGAPHVLIHTRHGDRVTAPKVEVALAGVRMLLARRREAAELAARLVAA